MSARNPAVPRRSRQVLTVCWGSYAAAYLGRVNYAVIIPFLIADLGISKARTGMVGTVFFWAYALGQYNSGIWGDRVNTRTLITVGLLGSAVCNLAAGAVSSPLPLTLFWGMNGIFQALFWAPLIRLLKNFFSPDQANRVGMIMSTSMIGGYALAWGLLGVVMTVFGWRFGFWLPAAAMILYAAVWLRSIHGEEADVPAAARNVRRLNTWNYLRSEKLGYLLPLGLVKGFVKEGISLWAPLLMVEYFLLESGQAMLLILLIPFVGFFGIVFSGWLHRRTGQNVCQTLTVILSFTMLMILGIPTLGTRYGLLGLLLTALVNAGIYGANNILMATVPLQLIKSEYAAGATGFLNGSAYLGGGLSGIVTGLIADRLGWNAVVIMWILLLALMLLLLQFSRLNSAHIEEDLK